MGDFLKQFQTESEKMKREIRTTIESNTERLYRTILGKVSKPSVLAFEKKLNSRPGALRDSLKKETVLTPQGFQVNIFFDRRMAGDSRFIISGTRRISPNDFIGRSWTQLGMWGEEEE